MLGKVQFKSQKGWLLSVNIMLLRGKHLLDNLSAADMKSREKIFGKVNVRPQLCENVFPLGQVKVDPV